MNFLIILNKVILFFILLSGCRSEELNDFILQNKSSKVVEKIEISVSGNNFVYKNFKPGQSVKQSYNVSYDDHFVIRVYYSKNKVIEKSNGYLTSGIKASSQIILLEDKVEYTQTILPNRK